MSTLNVATLQNSGGTGTAATLASINGGPISGARNRIINGDMRIDQRNAGAAVTQSTTTLYTIDRWAINGSVASKFTAQQNAGAVTPPPGYTNYLGITSSSAYTVTGNESYQIFQVIEGLNASDFAWGTANAVPITLSFWVRSSLTGTFGGSIATTKTTVWVLPFTYTISSANTWTYVTVSIPAATSTSGINTDNSGGIFVRFGLGAAGTAAGGTAGTWTSAGNFIQPSGTVSVVGTNGATWMLTGVQIEQGTVATPFERRSFGHELMLCQRYYWQSKGNIGTASSTTNLPMTMPLQVTMRTAPTIGKTSGNIAIGDMISAGTTSSSSPVLDSTYLQNEQNISFAIPGFTGLTAGKAYRHEPTTSNPALITASAEL